MNKTVLRAVSVLLTVLTVVIAGPQQALGQAKCSEAKQVSVPCEGTLLPDAWAEDGLSCISAELPECKAQKALAEKLSQIELLGLNKQLLISQELNKRLIDSIGSLTVTVPPEVPWYEHRLTYLLVGSLIGIGAGSAIVALGR